MKYFLVAFNRLVHRVGNIKSWRSATFVTCHEPSVISLEVITKKALLRVESFDVVELISDK